MKRLPTWLLALLALFAGAAHGDDARVGRRAPFLVIGDTNAARLALDSARTESPFTIL